MSNNKCFPLLFNFPRTAREKNIVVLEKVLFTYNTHIEVYIDNHQLFFVLSLSAFSMVNYCFLQHYTQSHTSLSVKIYSPNFTCYYFLLRYQSYKSYLIHTRKLRSRCYKRSTCLDISDVISQNRNKFIGQSSVHQKFAKFSSVINLNIPTLFYTFY